MKESGVTGVGVGVELHPPPTVRVVNLLCRSTVWCLYMWRGEPIGTSGDRNRGGNEQGWVSSKIREAVGYIGQMDRDQRAAVEFWWCARREFSFSAQLEFVEAWPSEACQARPRRRTLDGPWERIPEAASRQAASFEEEASSSSCEGEQRVDQGDEGNHES